MINQLNFSKYFNKFNIFSLVIFSFSIIIIIFKGLNYGIDFKGGTLIELKTSNDIQISDIRFSLNKLNLGDVSVKEFGKKGNYIIKIEKKFENKNNLISEIKDSISQSLNADVNFRRVENVGPKVSAELLKSGILAISLSFSGMSHGSFAAFLAKDIIASITGK